MYFMKMFASDKLAVMDTGKHLNYQTNAHYSLVHRYGIIKITNPPLLMLVPHVGDGDGSDSPISFLA